jgi:hypothetical protein
LPAGTNTAKRILSKMVGRHIILPIYSSSSFTGILIRIAQPEIWKRNATGIPHEAGWLIKCLRPDHNTIANFRRDDPESLREGFSYLLTKKGMSRAGSDVGFMFIAYNLRRIGNILTREVLKEYLRILVSVFLTFYDLLRGILMQYTRAVFMEIELLCKNQVILKPA